MARYRHAHMADTHKLCMVLSNTTLEIKWTSIICPYTR
jgi:hypothetical protein